MTKEKLQAIMDRATPRDRWQRFVGLSVPWALTSREWDAWHKSTRAAMPIKYWLGWRLPGLIDRVLHLASEARRWVLYRTTRRHRYHLLDLRRGDPSGKYRAGWIDTDTQLELANVALVRNFVELELPRFERGGWRDGEAGTHERAKRLNNFWTVRLPKLREDSAAVLHEAFGGDHMIGDDLTPEREAAAEKHTEMEANIKKEIAAAMCELVEIREGLWT